MSGDFSPYADLVLRLTDAAIELLAGTGFYPDGNKIARIIGNMLFPDIELAVKEARVAEISKLARQYIAILDTIEAATGVPS